MTYKLNPAIKKIESPVNLIFPDGNKKSYENGAAAADDVFEKHYIISGLRAVDDEIEIEVTEAVILPVNWTEEEQTFF